MPDGSDPHQMATLEYASSASTLIKRYLETRKQTLSLCRHLSAEDMLAQSMPDASPVKWHLAHTTWFYETFILLVYAGAYSSKIKVS